MNEGFARRAFVIAAAGVAVMVCVTVYMVASQYSSTHQSADPEFAPTKIAVPESFRRKLLLRLSKDASPTEHDGSALYREWFASGWIDCADSFVKDWKAGDVSYWSYEPEGDSDLGAPWIIQAPDEINDARRDGWRACRTEIQALIKTRSEGQVRAMLAK